jgi:hypothetical protein
LWIAFRFVVFGAGGFVLLWFSTIALGMGFSPSREHWISPYFALPLAFAGALMMLFGAGEWGRWAYLLVFVSTPVVLFLGIIIPFPKWVDDLSKESFVLLLILPFILSFIGVRHYYRRRDARNNSTEHKEVNVPVSKEQISK